MIELNKEEQDRKDIILLVIIKKLKQVEAANKLGISDRQVRRIVADYCKNGDSAFIHGNCGKESTKKFLKN